jgi:hypothetical protein
VTAQLRVVCRYAVANLKCRYFGANRGDDAHGFMAWDERELGDELAFVDMLDIEH